MKEKIRTKRKRKLNHYIFWKSNHENRLFFLDILSVKIKNNKR